MPAIDGDRLLRDLYAVREIGKYKTGVHRPTYSQQDVEARHWLAARLSEAGLIPRSTVSGMSMGAIRLRAASC
jgi:N-carbamoyl-L-amino-acid hydrolase